jgi:hypothetical protein
MGYSLIDPASHELRGRRAGSGSIDRAFAGLDALCHRSNWKTVARTGCAKLKALQPQRNAHADPDAESGRAELAAHRKRADP